jgi:hypothetical protein
MTRRNQTCSMELCIASPLCIIMLGWCLQGASSGRRKAPPAAGPARGKHGPSKSAPACIYYANIPFLRAHPMK